MRNFEKWAWVSVVIVMLAPIIALMLSGISNNGQMIPLGETVVEWDSTNSRVTIGCEDGTWAEYIVAPLVEGEYDKGLMFVCGRFLNTMQTEVGVKMSTPAVYIFGVGVLLFVGYMIHFITDFLTLVPKWFESLYKRYLG